MWLERSIAAGREPVQPSSLLSGGSPPVIHLLSIAVSDGASMANRRRPGLRHLRASGKRKSTAPCHNRTIRCVNDKSMAVFPREAQANFSMFQNTGLPRPIAPLNPQAPASLPVRAGLLIRLFDEN